MRGCQEEIWNAAQETDGSELELLRLLPPKLKTRYCSKERFTLSRNQEQGETNMATKARRSQQCKRKLTGFQFTLLKDQHLIVLL